MLQEPCRRRTYYRQIIVEGIDNGLLRSNFRAKLLFAYIPGHLLLLPQPWASSQVDISTQVITIYASR